MSRYDAFVVAANDFADQEQVRLQLSHSISKRGYERWWQCIRRIQPKPVHAPLYPIPRHIDGPVEHGRIGVVELNELVVSFECCIGEAVSPRPSKVDLKPILPRRIAAPR